MTGGTPNPHGLPAGTPGPADNGHMTAVPVESLAAPGQVAARARAGEPLDLRTAIERLGRDQFRRALVRRFIPARVDPGRAEVEAGKLPALVTDYPADAADVVMGLIDALLGQ